MEKKEKVSQLGYVAGGIAWLALVYMMGSSFACVEYKSCDGGDFVLGAIIAIGFVGPAYIFARIVTEVTKS
jgi:hypothetical protein